MKPRAGIAAACSKFGSIAVAVVAVVGSSCAEGITSAPASARIDIPGATFMMGGTLSCRDNLCMGDRLPHSVRVPNFRIDATEVTLQQYTVCVGQAHCPAADIWDHSRPNRPVVVAEIAGARAYCAAQGGRLPTEAEWELAARSGKGAAIQAFPWGTDPVGCDKLASADCTTNELLDVGASVIDVTPLGVHDLGGNVAEWVDDDYTPAPGCTSESPYATLCGLDSSCVSRRCTGDMGACRAGCAVDVDPMGKAGPSYCEIASETVVSPLHRTRMSLPMYKGGAVNLPACATDPSQRAAFDLRTHDHRPSVGFRCAYDVTGQSPPAVHVTERIALPTRLDCSTLTVTLVPSGGLTSEQFSDLQLSLETDEKHFAAIAAPDSVTFACVAQPKMPMLIVQHAPPRTFNLKVVFNDGAGACQFAVIPFDLTAGEIALAVARQDVTFSPCP